jgi:hypothetical protein
MTESTDATIANSRGGATRFRRWAAKESIEDYSLRYAPTTFRRWTPVMVASTALGGIAYLADYAIGSSIVLANGAPSAVVGILLAPSAAACHHFSCLAWRPEKTASFPRTPRFTKTHSRHCQVADSYPGTSKSKPCRLPNSGWAPQMRTDQLATPLET